MNICLFTEEEISKPLSIRDERGSHIIKILHKKESDMFSAGIIGGMAGKAEITKIEIHEEKTPDGKKSFDAGFIHFEFHPETDGKKLNPLAMIIGFPRPIQLKRLLRDMAALGIAEVHLCATELTEKSYLKSDLANSDAGEKMLLEGTVQAASTNPPKLFIHGSLKECIDEIEKNHSPNHKYSLDNISPAGSLFNAVLEEKPEFAVAAVGSERGWTDAERNLMKEKGFTLLSMGNRVMRTETAATVAASIILGAMGILD